MGPITVASLADRADNLDRIRELLDGGGTGEDIRGVNDPADRPYVVENRAERRARERRRG